MLRTTAIAAALLMVAAQAATAAPLTINFCSDTVLGAAECSSDHIAEARLTLEEIAGGDLNDYTATLFFRGAAALAPAVIDQVQFTIGTAGNSDYEALPSLTIAPGGTVGDPNGDWVAHFGGVPNCGGPGNTNSVCGVGTGGLLGNNGELTWVFTLDLKDSFGVLAQDHFVNMRASLTQGQFGPSGGNLSGGSSGSGNSSSLPEPAVISLLGVGVGLVRKMRIRA